MLPDNTFKFFKYFKRCTQQIQELVITKINNAIAQEISDSVEVLKENYIGTKKGCLQSLEDMNGSVVASENLQNSIIVMCRMLINSIERSSANDALKQILNSAYQVEFTLTGSSNILKALIERMKEVRFFFDGDDVF